MADDDEIVVRFLNMVRGSLDEKNQRLLEELRLRRPFVLSRLRRASVTSQKDEDPGVSPEVAA